MCMLQARALDAEILRGNHLTSALAEAIRTGRALVEGCHAPSYEGKYNSGPYNFAPQFLLVCVF